MRRLFTIGYEAAHLSDFIATLCAAETDVLIDVRELPMSRRRGFSKTALAAALQAVGIEYVHVRRLGSPRDLRHRLRENRDYERFFVDYGVYLSSQQEVLEELAEDHAGESVALMCFEKKHEECHRSSVASAIGRLVDLEPTHLEVKDARSRIA